jgi:SAM-dependent methyltransferase
VITILTLFEPGFLPRVRILEAMSNGAHDGATPVYGPNPATEPASEIERIRREYDSRARSLPADLYAWHREEIQYWQAGVARVCARLLDGSRMLPLTGAAIADVGCGEGRWLLEFLQWGAAARNLHGIDLLEGRVAYARERLVGADLRCGDVQRLPWPDGSFDLVTQFTVFSSILDHGVRARVASEMRRVLRPGGRILWYDCLRSNPSRPAVRGLSPADVHRLFPSSSIRFIRTTLAPPIARSVARRSWLAALALESLPFACTHLTALISPCR